MADPSEPSKQPPEAEKKKQEQTVPFHELFSFADRLDRLLMLAGTLGAVVHGSAMPVFFLLFGDLVNGFGKNQMDLRRMTDEVSKVSRATIIISFRSDRFPFYLHLCHSCSTRSTLSTWGWWCASHRTPVSFDAAVTGSRRWTLRPLRIQLLLLVFFCLELVAFAFKFSLKNLFYFYCRPKKLSLLLICLSLSFEIVGLCFSFDWMSVTLPEF